MNSRLISLLILTAITSTSKAQLNKEFIFQPFSKELSFVVMDSSHGSQSVIIEYPQFLALIETPMIDAGGGKKHDLTDDTTSAKAYKTFLSKRFPGKPVKYIFSSHWHQHSLSGISPFLENGARLVTTSGNINYALQNGLDQFTNPSKIQSQLIVIKKDTTLLTETASPIKVVYLDSTYKNKPTNDYLFFFLVSQGILHASCMGAISSRDFSKTGQYFYHERLIDLSRAINEKNLPVKQLIRLGREDFNGQGFQPGIYNFKDVNKYINAGQSPEEAMKPFIQLNFDVLQKNRDSITNLLIERNIPNFVINKSVYTCIRNKEFKKALLFAQILNLHSPGFLTFIDTMGEAYFVNNFFVPANYYSKMLFENDPKWDGGIKIWEENKKNNDY
ncbi:MAG: hypothetical protein LW852_12075 [Sediminibacterium sp.]|jgi:hypothetical protein|nr:hypothetical protein [Sediminibacterium sp.]